MERDDLSKVEQVCEELRHLQWKTNCSTKTLKAFLHGLRCGQLGSLVRELDELPQTVEQADELMQSLVCFLLALSFICFLLEVPPIAKSPCHALARVRGPI